MTTVSTSAFYDRSITDMANLRAQANDMQTQISSGNRLAQSSDDPVAAAQMRALQRADALSTVDTANTNAAKTDLTTADNTLSNFATIVSRLQELATQAASGTLNDSDRAGIGAEVTALRTNLVSLANTKDSSGNALFGGNGSGPAYTLDASGNATYTGGSQSQTLSLGNGLTVTKGITGPEFLNFQSNGSSTDLLTAVKTLGDALSTTGGSVTPQAAAQAALDQLNSATTAISTAQTVVGARLSWIDTTTSINTQIAQQRTQTESDVGGTDIATTISRLQQTMTVLEASQASFTKLASLSLFSMIN